MRRVPGPILPLAAIVLLAAALVAPPAAAGRGRAVFRTGAELAVRVRVVSPCAVRPDDPACDTAFGKAPAGADAAAVPVRNVRVREETVNGVRVRTIEY